VNSNVSVYVPPGVDELIALYRDLFHNRAANLSVRDELTQQADRLLAAHRRGDPVSTIQISNWLPRLVGRRAAEILAADFSLDDARLTIAREHGFADWRQVVEHGNEPPDAPFEAAVDAVVNGDLAGLRELLDRDPGLVKKQSTYGHRATLLHYLAANGVETRRQIVPSNAAEIARLLIERRSNVAAAMKVYGGEFDTVALATSSAHPQAAGVLNELLAEIRS